MPCPMVAEQTSRFNWLIFEAAHGLGIEARHAESGTIGYKGTKEVGLDKVACQGAGGAI